MNCRNGGFFNRSDRDKFVTILWDNITDKNKFNFNVLRTENQGFTYDYGSVNLVSERTKLIMNE